MSETMMKTCAIYAPTKPSVKSASTRSGVYLGDLKGGAGGDSSFGDGVLGRVSKMQ